MAEANPTDSPSAVNRLTTKTRHGFAGTPVYQIWQAVKQRCCNPKSRHYGYYGGRGITICPEWRDSFLAFYRDMGDPPTPGHQVERINNNKGYEPGNCRWATRDEQMRNTRRCRLITFDGRTMVLTDWAKELGISPNTLRVRISQWGVEKALSTPGPRGRMNSPRREETCHVVEFRGEQRTLTEWAGVLGIKVSTLHRRLKLWGIERALTTPLLRQGTDSRL